MARAKRVLDAFDVTSVITAAYSDSFTVTIYAVDEVWNMGSFDT